ncbi:MAG: AI-2E family transporter [Pseudomonadota bacterium]
MSNANASLSLWAERAVGLLAIAIIVIACFWITLPLLGVLVWGALIAISLSPLHRMLADAGGDRPKAVAALIVIVLLTVIVFPLSFLPGSVERAVEGLAKATNNWTELNLPPPPDWVTNFPLLGATIGRKWAALAGNSGELLASVRPLAGPAVQWLAGQGAALGLAFLEIFVAVILAGIFLVRQADTTTALHRIAHRLGGVSGENLLELAVRTVRNVALGVIGTALIQGALSGVGFIIAGVPFAVALGALSFGTAMLQIGTWLVWIPSALWLTYQGETGWALFTAVLGVVINVIDNIIKPVLIGRGAGVPLWIIFIGVIGGILTIGFMGIFIGPLILAAGYSIITGWLADESRHARSTE